MNVSEQSSSSVLMLQMFPFVFASGYTDTGALQGEFPDVQFVGKPYSEKALVEAISTAVRSRG